ncbi:MAG: hypothetical protein IKH01_15155 [Prevotella sp.]|nr:hypothetical protein [Prevotella sp.]
MAVNSKDIETLWKQYSEEGVKKGISVVQFFESTCAIKTKNEKAIC